MTREGSYRLTGNLAVANASTDAIVVSANDVVIDLAATRSLGRQSALGCS